MLIYGINDIILLIIGVVGEDMRKNDKLSKNKEKGRILEQNYKWLWELGVNKNCIITTNKYYKDSVTGEDRELDVFIENYDDKGNLINTTMVECRNRKNVQDVRWVEEVVTKKNDLKIDRAIIVTTSDFTEPARKKAKYYNIEVERSSPLTNEFIEKQKKECKALAKFIFMECVDLSIITSTGYYNYKQLRESKEIKKYIKRQINEFVRCNGFVTDLQRNILSGETEKDFFKDLNNSINADLNFSPRTEHDNSICIENLNNNFLNFGTVNKILFKLIIRPKIIEFPLSRVITIFDDEVEKIYSNKRHKSLYENEKIEVSCQFHNEKIHYHMKLKQINRYWRYIGGDMTLYALLDNIDKEKTTFDIENSPEDILGEVYFGNILD